MKLNHTSILLFIFLVFVFSLSGNQLLASDDITGIIKIPAGQAPQKSFRLYRNDSEIKPVTYNEIVKNGDVIVPYAGKNVKLIFANTSCGDVEIIEPTVVNCHIETSEIGIIEKVGIFLSGKIKGRDLVPTPTLTLRGKRDTSCYPVSDLQVAPWPVDGTTFLYDQPLLFRFSTAEEPCTSATLVIQSTDIDSDSPIEIPFLLGELKSVSRKLSPGQNYEWFVRQDQQIISNHFHFQVLNREKTYDINSKLAEVAGNYPQCPPLLAQVVFLQLYSDENSELDLYGDSLRLLHANGTDVSQAYFELTDRLYDHEGSGY